MKIQHTHIQCECHHPDHLARFTLEPYLDDIELTLSFNMNPKQPFFRRVVSAFQYVFGINKHRYWSDSWTTVLVGRSDAVRMHNILEKYLALLKLRRIKQAKLLRESLKC